MEDLQTSLMSFLNELEEMQLILETHCSNFKFSLSTLNDRRMIEESKLEAAPNDEHLEELTVQLDEIDILIEKAEKVFTGDIDCGKVKKKSIGNNAIGSSAVLDETYSSSSKEKCQTNKSSHLPKRSDDKSSGKTTKYLSKFSGKKHSRVGSQSNSYSVKRDQISRKSTSYNTEKKCYASRNTIHSNVDIKKGKLRSVPDGSAGKQDGKPRSLSKFDLNDEKQTQSKLFNADMSTSANLPYLFDVTFENEYSSVQNSCRSLSKLRSSALLQGQISKSIAEFMSIVQSKKCGDISKASSSPREILDFFVSGGHSIDMKNTLREIDKIRTMGNKLIYHSSVNQDSYDLDVDSNAGTENLKKYYQTLQLKSNVNFHKKLRGLLANDELLKNGISEETGILQYRQLLLLLSESNSYPSLVKNQ